MKHLIGYIILSAVAIWNIQTTWNDLACRIFGVAPITFYDAFSFYTVVLSVGIGLTFGAQLVSTWGGLADE